MLRYLAGTKDMTLRMGGCDARLELYSDSDFAQDTRDRKSRSGMLGIYGAGAITWKSKKQDIVTLSTMEAEYVALAEAAKEAQWMRALFKDFGREIDGPITIHEDNQAALKFTKNPTQHNRSKHIDVRFHVTRELSAKGIIEVKYVPTNLQLADSLTKPLGKVRLLEHLPEFGLFREGGCVRE
jgi:hypothetical protein